MITSWKILGEAKRRWVPTQRRATACHVGGTTSGLCPSGALPPPHASAIGAASYPFCSGAALQSDRGQPARIIHEGSYETVETPSETGARSLGDWLRRLRRCLSRYFRTGTGAKKKGASPQRYVDRLRGEPARRQACRSGVSAVAVEAFVNDAGRVMRSVHSPGDRFIPKQPWEEYNVIDRSGHSE